MTASNSNLITNTNFGRGFGNAIIRTEAPTCTSTFTVTNYRGVKRKKFSILIWDNLIFIKYTNPLKWLTIFPFYQSQLQISLCFDFSWAQFSILIWEKLIHLKIQIYHCLTIFLSITFNFGPAFVLMSDNLKAWVPREGQRTWPCRFPAHYHHITNHHHYQCAYMHCKRVLKYC